jgi:inositol hexakisphosphate/diphosphoinositol-pentakisphosphate kinase
MHSDHLERFTDEQLSGILQSCEVTHDRFAATACPLCHDWKLFPAHSTYATATQFRRHLGRHLEQIALFALPKLEAGDQNDNDEDSEDVVVGQSSHTTSDKSSNTGPPRTTRSKGTIGICAFDAVARSKPSRNIWAGLASEFEIRIFGDKAILDEDIENWPVCDFFISFYSEGFPFDKAIAYAQLRKPFCVNDLPMQCVLLDRRLCLQILDKIKVSTPKRVEVSRDGGPQVPSDAASVLFENTGLRISDSVPVPQELELVDEGNAIRVDGVTLSKPFVEKPVNAEDHNIYIYYHKKDGGGGRKLFKRFGDKHSERDETLDIPRSISDPSSSYVYEEFLQANDGDGFRVYTVDPNHYPTETNIWFFVDEIVKRNISRKRLGYVPNFSEEESAWPAKISLAFKQRFCQFDVLRSGEHSYVIDVNGWSFAEDDMDYRDKAAMVLKNLFLEEIRRKEAADDRSVSFGRIL